LLLVPVYLRLLGIEAYGLVGFYTAMQAVANILDLGLSPTVNRELARYSTIEGSGEEARNLVRTFEVGYWLIGLTLALLVFAAAPFISVSWIRAEHIPPETVRRAVQLMALATGLQWPLTLYQGGLMGLGRPAVLQSATAVTVTLRTVGAAFVLWKISPTITAFFLWQTVAIGIQTTVTTLCLWRCMPFNVKRPRIDVSLLRSRWRFAAGITATSVVTLTLTQLDKIVLSKVVTLQLFGYYVLSATVSDSLYKIVTPIYSSLFPRFSVLVARGDKAAMAALYHRSCQLLSVLVLPLALVVAVFPGELIGAWTNNPQAALGAGPVVRILILGTALNGLMTLPYAAQLAYGWVSLALVANSVALAILAPTLLILVARYGLVGAAVTWLLLNTGYLLIEVPIMHRRILRGELGRWYFVDIAGPLVPAALVIVLSRYAIPSGLPRLTQCAVIAGVAVAGVAAAALGASEVRTWLVGQIFRAPEVA